MKLVRILVLLVVSLSWASCHKTAKVSDTVAAGQTAGLADPQEPEPDPGKVDIYAGVCRIYSTGTLIGIDSTVLIYVDRSVPGKLVVTGNKPVVQQKEGSADSIHLNIDINATNEYLLPTSYHNMFHFVLKDSDLTIEWCYLQEPKSSSPTGGLIPVDISAFVGKKK